MMEPPSAPTAGPAPSHLLEEARTALRDVTDPSARAGLLAVLAAVQELQLLTSSIQGIDARMKQLNRYLGALANKP
ncbi:hypothetical protein ACFY7H_14140 [Streptomyces sp. NPDC012794]|uniref:hypothetical protein n=1 Tax=Streptomyces sp. NPDC012794 TaxID=3364850 RepID=UPI003696F619